MMWGCGQSSGLDSARDQLAARPGQDVTSRSSNFLAPVCWGLPPPLCQGYHEASMEEGIGSAQRSPANCIQVVLYSHFSVKPLAAGLGVQMEALH